MSNRRNFIKKGGLGILGFSLFPNTSFGKQDDITITILHTNDMHSHIHPFSSGKIKDWGGWHKELV